MWNAGLTKEPTTKNYKEKMYTPCRREKKVCEDEQGKIKGTKKVAYPWRRRYGLYLSRLSRHHACPLYGCNPFPLGVSRLVGPREIETDVHPLLFFSRALTDADGAAVRLSFFCLAVSSPI